MKTQLRNEVDRVIYRATELAIQTYELQWDYAKLRGEPVSTPSDGKREYADLTRDRDAMKAEFRRQKIPVPRAP